MTAGGCCCLSRQARSLPFATATLVRDPVTKPNAGSEPFHNGASSAGHGNYPSNPTVGPLGMLPLFLSEMIPQPLNSLPDPFLISPPPRSLCPASFPKWKPKVEHVTIFLKPTGPHHTQSKSQTYPRGNLVSIVLIVYNRLCFCFLC